MTFLRNRENTETLAQDAFSLEGLMFHERVKLKYKYMYKECIYMYCIVDLTVLFFIIYLYYDLMNDSRKKDN